VIINGYREEHTGCLKMVSGAFNNIFSTRKLEIQKAYNINPFFEFSSFRAVVLRASGRQLFRLLKMVVIEKIPFCC